MKEKIDPLIIAMVIMFACVMLAICYMSTLERQDKNERAELIKEAIEKNWTPEQIKVLIEARE
jgi:hypothetical protein